MTSDSTSEDFEDERTPLLTPHSTSSVRMDDSMGLSAAERAYIRVVEPVGLDVSDDSEEDGYEGGDEDNKADDSGGGG